MTTENDNNGIQTPSRNGLPESVAESTLVTYRSVGIGVFGVVMRFAGMPLEKIALYMNSSQVSGKNQFRQAARLTFQDGVLSPYRVVTPASLTAWFLQYSIMGFAFQFFDHGLSNLLGVKPMYYGEQLMEPATQSNDESPSYKAKFAFKTFLAPVLAATMESKVSNRAEVQRYFGPDKFAKIETRLARNAIAKAAGPAFMANATRNMIMCNTTFILTPLTYKLYFPQEEKNMTTLFYYGLGMNVFVGNVVAITQQALWGRTLDYCERTGQISYRNVVREGLAKDGMAAFFTTPKWFSRVLMNAPAQGVLPWFYNEVLPLGEGTVLNFVKKYVYTPSVEGGPASVTSVVPIPSIQVSNEEATGARPLANSPMGKQ